MAQAGGRAAPFFRGNPTPPTKGSLRCDRCASLSRQPAAAMQVGSTRPSAVMMPFTHGTSQVYSCREMPRSRFLNGDVRCHRRATHQNPI